MSLPEQYKNKKYEMVIGLEIHTELSTKSKIYCSCTTEFGGEPNTHCCPICSGMPGVLPVLNKRVVEYAAKAGLAMNCSISDFSKQDRKNYFYPDLPKAYQVSQFDLPLCKTGHVDINVDGETRRIGITRIHMEEDAGKLMHDMWNKGSLVDFNRCGVPLIEIVTEPDMRSSEEAKVFLETVKSILEYIDVSDCKMQEGSLRADVNLSIRPVGQEKLGTRTEMKNMNSFKAIIRAIESEYKRQIDVLESGGNIVQETRRWDDDAGVSYSMRSKEEAHDYRYFPEPDLAPIVVDSKWLNEIKDSLPELPESRKKKYVEDYELPVYDAQILTSSRHLADFFEEALKDCGNPKHLSNWIMGDLLKELKDRELEIYELSFGPRHFAKLVNLVVSGRITVVIAREVFSDMFDSGKDPEDIVKEKGLEVVSDEGELKEIVIKIIKANPASVNDYKAGKKKAAGFIVGQVMKETKGKANPQMVNKLIIEELEKK
jgi:aspartyl-tRNA(Asn)/glutamyl-tRNA(Gln) amidotransferase subunit B